MLINQARNLTSLDYNAVNRLRSTLATTERLIAEAQGLVYDVTNMDREFARLYPHEYAATVSGDRMAQDARAPGPARKSVGLGKSWYVRGGPGRRRSVKIKEKQRDNK